MKTVAVVIPIYKSSLSADEQISLRQLLKFLGGHDIFYVAPRGLDIQYQKFPTIYFDAKYFKSLFSYSDLLLTEKFYRAFAEYEYILLYQLDCLVFSDQLLAWCNKGYDYIGAPWLAGQGAGYNDTDTVGNGGFSLRKISSCLKVLERANSSGPAARKILYSLIRFSGGPKAWLKNIRQAWRESPFSSFVITEDYFWSFEAKKYYSDFNIAPVDQAMQFSFEVNPRFCFERNNRQLPFGCHAWAKYDRNFWEHYLLNNDNGQHRQQK